LIAAVGFASPAVAQQWPPAGPTIRLINPFPPGGTAETLSRAIANKIAADTGATIVVENKVGASTVIAVNELKRSAPDGTTILYTVTGTTSQLPHLYAKPPFDPFTDFTPLGVIAYNKLVLVARGNAPFDSVKGLIDYARANPGKINYASFGNGSFPHILSEALKKSAGISMVHIPYKGGADASRAVMAGDVDILFDAPLTAINNASAGRVKVLAVAGNKRIASIPNVPTMAEEGIQGFDTPGLEQVLGPANMAPQLAAQINAAIMKAVRAPEVRVLYERNGFDLVMSTPSEHAVIMRESYDRWGEIIKKVNIKLD
jgi:tripartite-type tricarboxylate transporter receptor subunit TctC